MTFLTLQLAALLSFANCNSIISNPSPLEGLNCDEQKVYLQKQIELCTTCETNSDCTVGPVICGITPCYGAVISKDFDQAGFEGLGTHFAEMCNQDPIACACPIPNIARCENHRCTVKIPKASN